MMASATLTIVSTLIAWDGNAATRIGQLDERDRNVGSAANVPSLARAV
jgi:hypothetical protein